MRPPPGSCSNFQSARPSGTLEGRVVKRNEGEKKERNEGKRCGDSGGKTSNRKKSKRRAKIDENNKMI